MRILFVTRKFPPSVGGMELYSEELFHALVRKGADVTLFKPNPPIIGRPSPVSLLVFFVKASISVIRNARTAQVILFGDALLTPLAGVAKLSSRGAATVVTAHGNDVYFARKGGLLAAVYKTLLKRFARWVDLLIANSSDTEREANAFGFRHTLRIPLATQLVPNPEKISLPESTILFAGRLIHYKGLAWFITEVLPKVDSRIQLLVAGPPWDAEEMNAVNECPRARYLGNLSREALVRLRMRVIMCIMPNLPPNVAKQNEGFGLSALESAAAGTPVVASRVGGLAEAVVDGVTGFLIEPMDAVAFAKCINKIAGWDSVRRQQFSAAARETIAERFTWDRVADDYLTKFECLVGPERASSKPAQ